MMWLRWFYKNRVRTKRCVCGARVPLDRPICNSFPAQCVDREKVYRTVRLGMWGKEYDWDELDHSSPSRYL